MTAAGEKEWHFAARRIDSGFERLCSFSPAAATELIIGHNVTKEYEREILIALSYAILIGYQYLRHNYWQMEHSPK